MKIVVAMPVTEEHKKWLNAAAGDYPVYFADNQAAVGVQVPEDVLSDTEIIIGNLEPELVKKAPHLRWMQLNSAGTGAYIKKGVLPEGWRPLFHPLFHGALIRLAFSGGCVIMFIYFC